MRPQFCSDPEHPRRIATKTVLALPALHQAAIDLQRVPALRRAHCGAGLRPTICVHFSLKTMPMRLCRSGGHVVKHLSAHRTDQVYQDRFLTWIILAERANRYFDYLSHGIIVLSAPAHCCSRLRPQLVRSLCSWHVARLGAGFDCGDLSSTCMQAAYYGFYLHSGNQRHIIRKETRA